MTAPGSDWPPRDDAPTTEATALEWIKQGRAFDPQLLAFAARHPQESQIFQALLSAVRGSGGSIRDWRAGVKKNRPLRVVGPDERAEGKRRFERGDHLELAEALLAHVEPKAEHRACDEGSIFRYSADSGLWSKVDSSTLACGVHTFAGSVVRTVEGDRPLLINTQTVNGAIEQAQHITRRPEFFAKAPHGLAFANGFMRATDKGLEWAEHAPDHRARIGYSHPYLPGLTSCQKWLDFLKSLWPVRLEDADGNPRDVADIEADARDQAEKMLLVQQVFGASLVGVATRFQTALILFGEGSNGKSTLLKTIERLFPENSLAHVAPQDLGDEYRVALLAGKLLNTVGELPTEAILESSRLKSVIDGTEITGRQIRQEPITFTPRAGMVYSANLWPPVSDMSHGFWSRFVVVTFKETFERGTAGEDLDAVMAREEGPGIIAWMLEGAVSVLRGRGYAIPVSSRAALDEWRFQACTVAAFLRECCETTTEPATAAKGLFAAYVSHTKEGQRSPVSSQKFANRMAGLGHAGVRRSDGVLYPVRLRAGWAS